MNQIHGSGHRAEVHPFRSGAALEVKEIALERLGEQLPGSLAIRADQHPGVHHLAQGGAVGRARRVVLDVLGDGVVLEGVAEAGEELPQLVRGEQVEKHQRVRLLRGLVPVRAVPLGLEDPVQPLDVPVPRPVAFPVELRQLFVALELAQDPVIVEGKEELAADLLPPLDLFAPQHECV